VSKHTTAKSSFLQLSDSQVDASKLDTEKVVVTSD